MSTSILDTTKKALDIPVDLAVFDGQITMHINTVFSMLNQLGIGPEFGFEIEDNLATWDLFLGIDPDPRLNLVKTYMYLRVRLIFDPPTTSFAITAMETLKLELEWRLNVQRESVSWVPPVTIIDGGSSI